ncbi:nitric oxide reductase NorQ protein [Mycobacterium sp. 88mf]|nr:nitric oxide reductase NorQ protein [Mycobacterium sp. 88mf]SFF39075.1 nitric oxide reductase NorQ protein [Mycobacterium sp. 455mf]
MPPPNAAIDISSPATERPFYHAVGNEERVFAAAFRQQLPVLLKGPTGCGKTRFVEAMAHEMGRPLITVACHDDLTTADLVGRFLLRGGETEWVDGPLTRAVREGAICYLDEVVEARQDTTVVLHPLADHRRTLPIERLGETLSAAAGFCLVVSYNPGYQSVLKDLKDSTRQRMVAIQFDYPHQDVERMIVQRESGIGPHVAEDLVRLAQAIRRLDGAGLREVSSTRVLIAAARLAQAGLSLREAAEAAIIAPLTDDHAVGASLRQLVDVYLAGQRHDGGSTADD